MVEETDIVERLRKQDTSSEADKYVDTDIFEEAALEIERLRAKVGALEHASGLTRVGQERGSEKSISSQDYGLYRDKPIV